MCEIEEKIIERVKEAFISEKEKDFTTYKNGTIIVVKYEGYIATATLTGRYNYICYIEYDDFSQTICGYWYDD